MAQVHSLHSDPQRIAFHVSNRFGATPPELGVEINGAAVQIQRLGSLISLARPAAQLAPPRLVVLVGTTRIYDEVLQP
jgi:hypothetical protein